MLFYKNRILSGFIFIIFLFTGSLSTAEENTVSPISIDGAITVDVEQAKKLFNEKAIFIDVRKESDWNAGRIPDAIHLDMKLDLTEESLSRVANKNDAIVFYCNGVECMRSFEASKMAVEWGYKDVNYFRLGCPAWKKEKNPVE